MYHLAEASTNSLLNVALKVNQGLHVLMGSKQCHERICAGRSEGALTRVILNMGSSAIKPQRGFQGCGFHLEPLHGKSPTTILLAKSTVRGVLHITV
jgi:hypothetical protein